MQERARRRILVIEDEADIAESLRYNLERDKLYSATVAATGEKGLQLARERPFDLVILDLMLPGIDGLEVCRALRSTPDGARLPILMLTARVEESDKLVGLEIGADDYMTKPFSMKEILARVKALLRRASLPADAPGPPLVSGPLELDLAGHILRVAGEVVAVTRMEFALLTALVRSRGRVLSRDQLLHSVWGRDYYGGTRTVDVHVRRLRKKLGAAGDLIETVFGVGYRFRESGAAGDE